MWNLATETPSRRRLQSSSCAVAGSGLSFGWGFPLAIALTLVLAFGRCSWPSSSSYCWSHFHLFRPLWPLLRDRRWILQFASASPESFPTLPHKLFSLSTGKVQPEWLSLNRSGNFKWKTPKMVELKRLLSDSAFTELAFRKLRFRGARLPLGRSPDFGLGLRALFLTAVVKLLESLPLVPTAATASAR